MSNPAGAIYCWGEGLNGNGTSNVEYAPTPIQKSGLSFAQLSASGIHACAVTRAGAGYCWGQNSDGDLGSASASGVTPVAVAGGHTFSTITVGGESTCGLTTSSSMLCWGSNSSLQLGLPPTADTSYAAPVPIPGMAGS